VRLKRWASAGKRESSRPKSRSPNSLASRHSCAPRPKAAASRTSSSLTMRPCRGTSKTTLLRHASKKRLPQGHSHFTNVEYNEVKLVAGRYNRCEEVGERLTVANKPCGRYSASMTTQTRKYAVSFPSRSRSNKRAGPTFFQLAKKHIVKGRRGGPRDLSRKIDEIAYGV